MIFYDTDALKYFFEGNGEDNDYDPEGLSSSTDAVISLYVIEEFLHNAIRKEWHKEWEYENFNEMWENFDKYKAFFEVVDISQNKVTQKFFMLFNFLRKNTNYVENYGGSNTPGGKDIMHVCSAELQECKTLVTCDSDYEIFKNARRRLENLNKIVIIDKNSDEIKEVPLESKW